MKKSYTLFTIAFILLFNLTSTAQFPHVAHLPPLNPGYPFIRGMIVDCADDIIRDISNGNALNLEQELSDYIRKNFIGYIILSGLEHAGVFGNPTQEAALRIFMRKTRISFPGIQIGISGSDEGSFQATGAITPYPFINSCFPNGSLNSINDFNNALNDAGLNAVNLKRSEINKFFYRAATFAYDPAFPLRCKFAFDAFYLEYRYWKHTSSLTAMQNEFTNYKKILSVMKVLKCNFHWIRNIDTEFLPTELFNLQAWTAIDQITEVDPLASRLIIPAFTNNVDGTFDQICKTLHFLSDRFSKPHSVIFIELSAESRSFNYCNSNIQPQDHLGNYLNGTVIPSGNLYSAEKKFLTKFNDPSYLCSLCSCRPYVGNHFSLLNIYGNILTGSIWRPYSMMQDHNLFRKQENADVAKKEIDAVAIQLIDINGRIIKYYTSMDEVFDEQLNGTLSEGIYFQKIVYKNGKKEVKKIFINGL